MGYLWGLAVDQILAEESVDGGTADLVQWTLTDHLNTVRDIAQVDPETGITSVVNRVVSDTSASLLDGAREWVGYAAFGRVTSETNPAGDSLFLFTARPFDAETKQVEHLPQKVFGQQSTPKNLNRWYDARVGRWLSEDPVGFAAGINLYAYCVNSPLAFSDATGEVGAWEPNTWYQLIPSPSPPRRRPGFWGGFWIGINWLVSPAPVRPPASTGRPPTSWIIQHVRVDFEVRDAKTGRTVRHPADDGKWDYWEAWEVRPGWASPITVPGQALDDEFSMSDGIPDTCGTIIFWATAQFYPNTTLPGDFVPNNPNTHARQLLSTASGSAITDLVPRSSPVSRTVVATWTTENHGRTRVFYGVSREAPEPWPGHIA